MGVSWGHLCLSETTESKALPPDHRIHLLLWNKNDSPVSGLGKRGSAPSRAAKMCVWGEVG